MLSIKNNTNITDEIKNTNLIEVIIDGIYFWQSGNKTTTKNGSLNQEHQSIVLFQIQNSFKHYILLNINKVLQYHGVNDH